MTRVFGISACSVCGSGFAKRGPRHIYCESCSTLRDLDRKRLWARNNPITTDQSRSKSQIRDAASRSFGEKISAEHKETITWDGSASIELDWYVRVSVPFTYSFSKNHIFTNTRHGHVALRREARAARDGLRESIRESLSSAKIVPVPNKVWIDIFVQKTDQRGDAVNVIDLACDALKEAIGVDDRWFSIRRLDWQITKTDPRIFVGVGQESRTPVQCCSSCGRILPYEAFNKKRSNVNGIDRTCRECYTLGRKV